MSRHHQILTHGLTVRRFADNQMLDRWSRGPLLMQDVSSWSRCSISTRGESRSAWCTPRVPGPTGTFTVTNDVTQ